MMFILTRFPLIHQRDQQKHRSLPIMVSELTSDLLQTAYIDAKMIPIGLPVRHNVMRLQGERFQYILILCISETWSFYIGPEASVVYTFRALKTKKVTPNK